VFEHLDRAPQDALGGLEVGGALVDGHQAAVRQVAREALGDVAFVQRDGLVEAALLLGLESLEVARRLGLEEPAVLEGLGRKARAARHPGHYARGGESER